MRDTPGNRGGSPLRWTPTGRRHPGYHTALAAFGAIVLIIATSHPTPGADPEPSSMPAGRGVYVSPARQQTIGVRTAPVEEHTLSSTIRTVGLLSYDETRVTQINPKIAGWVDQMFVDYVGKFVRRGQPLLTIYSPALVATEREYLLALQGYRQTRGSDFETARTGAESLLAASRERLRLWDISDAQIAELERSGQAKRTLTLSAPFDGVVLERNAFAGQYITPETTTIKLADLSTIWAIGQVFEYEASAVRVGQPVRIEFPYDRGTESLSGRIAFIYPDVDPMTRRIRVRAEFANPGFAFKPDTYATMVITGEETRQLAVPKEAVIDTGSKRYVILARPNGYFEPREIQIGPPADEYYPVRAGLQAGDQVVTSALFLIDSETNLKAAMQAMSMTMPGMGGGTESAEGTQGMEGMGTPGTGGAPPTAEHGSHTGQGAPPMPADMPMGNDR